jgi:tetratricopeptide (TPR) repeat protein
MNSAIHRSILCVDVEHFSDPRRTDLDQTTVRAGLYWAFEAALHAAEVRLNDDFHLEDRGDGLLALIPPEVPKSRLVTDFPQALVAALELHNERNRPPARIRVRMSLHAGEIRHDQHGVIGRPIIEAFRLLDAGAVKSALRDSTGALVIVASNWFFSEVIRHEPAAAPDAYRRVPIAVKETRTTAWVCLPDQLSDHPETPSPARPAAEPASTPRQLLAAVGDFVGRDDELKALRGLLDEPVERAPTVVVAVITGPAGVGKTALATHWAHEVRDRFPDGDLYVNLRGDDPDPSVPPNEALDRMLRALDVDAEKIPAGLEEKAALYRSRLNGRRVLIILDNAADVEQVRPLVPGSPGCVVVVTSRNRLSGLIVREGAIRIRLDRLSEAEAVALLREIIGRPEVDADPQAAATIALRCDYLPLALRVAAERAVDQHSSLADVADELAGEHHRLDLLDTDDGYTGVRAAFSWSYRALPAAVAQTFRLLSLHRGPDIGLEVVAALTGTAMAETRRSLDLLTGKHLVERTARDRFRLHVLLRCYAEELVREQGADDDWPNAERRMLLWYLDAAVNARSMLLRDRPEIAHIVVDEPRRSSMTFDTPAEAQRWYETERLNLIAAVHHAAHAGHHDLAWRLAFALNGFFYLRKYIADWTATQEVGLASARRVGDRIGEGRMLSSLAFAMQENHRPVESSAYYRQSLDIFRATKDRSGLGWAMFGFGHAVRGQRRFEESLGHYEEALDIFRAIGSRRGQCLVYLGLGYAFGGLRRFERSVECFQHAIRFMDENRRVEGWALHGLGYAYRGLQRIEEAVAHYERALRIFAEIGDWWGQGEGLYNLGKAQADAGQDERARWSMIQAKDIFHDLHMVDREAEVRARLESL